MEIGQKIELTIFIGMSPFLLMFSQFLFPYFYTKGIDYIQMGMLSAAYSFTCIIVLVTVGTVADLRGRKLTLSFFGICSSIFPILYIIFDNFVSFLALRTLESIKEPITVIRRAVLQDLSPKKSKGLFFGVTTAIKGLSWTLMPLIGGLIIDGFGFEIFAFVCFLITLIFALFVWFLFPETSRIRRGKVHFVRLSEIKNRFVVSYIVYSLLLGIPAMIGWVFLSVYAFRITKSFTGVGLVLFAGSVMTIFGRIPLGKFADKYGHIRIYILGMILSSVFWFLPLFCGRGDTLNPHKFCFGCK